MSQETQKYPDELVPDEYSCYLGLATLLNGDDSSPFPTYTRKSVSWSIIPMQYACNTTRAHPCVHTMHASRPLRRTQLWESVTVDLNSQYLQVWRTFVSDFAPAWSSTRLLQPLRARCSLISHSYRGRVPTCSRCLGSVYPKQAAVQALSVRTSRATLSEGFRHSPGNVIITFFEKIPP